MKKEEEKLADDKKGKEGNDGSSSSSEKDVETAAESSDPFYEDFMEERLELVKEACEGKCDIDELINHYLDNDWGN